MKKALILYWHGLGDVILLTPHLRHLYNKGYKTDLMCRAAVRESKLLDACPYVDKLITVENPWRSKLGFKRQAELNLELFHKLKKDYDWAGASPHKRPFAKHHKIDTSSFELGIDLKDKKLEVFIPPSAEEEATRFVGGDYIFVHRLSEYHKDHTWNPNEWIEANLPPMKMVYSDAGGKITRFDDINTMFAIARNAKHQVLISSVFASACDAMGCIVDAINYGVPDRKLWSLDQHRILHIREKGAWIK